MKNFPLRLVEILFAVRLFCDFAFASNDDHSRWIEHIIPEKYVRLRNPTYHLRRQNISGITQVYFGLTPRHVMSVEPKTMDFAVELSINLRWFDERLIIPKDIHFAESIDIDIPKEVAVKLWTPEIRLANCKDCDGVLADPGQQPFKLHRNLVVARLKKIFKFPCAIDLRNYPFDAQQCKIRVEKHGNRFQIPFLKWYTPDLPTKRIDVPPEYTLTGLKWKNCTESNNYRVECMEYVFHFRRMVANHVMLVFIPSMLIVILSWISFWLDVEVAAPRVALGLTSLLTLATQLYNSQRDLPPVSAAKAVDIWMFSCMFMVFSSLIEFAVANFWARRKKNNAKVAPETIIKRIAKSPLINIRRRRSNEQKNLTKKKAPSPLRTDHCSPIDFFARIAFPVAFIIFNIAFWGYFATTED